MNTITPAQIAAHAGLVAATSGDLTKPRTAAQVAAHSGQTPAAAANALGALARAGYVKQGRRISANMNHGAYETTYTVYRRRLA